MRRVINGAVIEHGNLLLVQKEKVYILPGGKPVDGESDEECLRREFDEELSGTRIRNIRPYQTFTGKAPHKNDPIEVIVYFADVDGSLGEASKEIRRYDWTNGRNGLPVSQVTDKILRALTNDRYLA